MGRRRTRRIEDCIGFLGTARHGGKSLGDLEMAAVVRRAPGVAGSNCGAANELNTRRVVEAGGVHYDETHRYVQMADSIRSAGPTSALR